MQKKLIKPLKYEKENKDEAYCVDSVMKARLDIVIINVTYLKNIHPLLCCNRISFYGNFFSFSLSRHLHICNLHVNSNFNYKW